MTRKIGPKHVRDWLSDSEYSDYVILLDLVNSKSNKKFVKNYKETLEKLASVRARSNGIPAKGLMISSDNGFSIIATEKELEEISVKEYGLLIQRYGEDIAKEFLEYPKNNKGFSPSINEAIQIVLKHVSKEDFRNKKEKKEEEEKSSNNGFNPFVELQ